MNRLKESVLQEICSVRKWIFERIFWQEPEFKAIYNMVDKIPGWLISPVEEYCLYRLALRLHPESIIVEIGSWKGRSTSCLAFGSKGKKSVIYALDIFLHFEEFNKNLTDCGLRDLVIPVKGRSEEIASRWYLPVDLLFIDGGHEYKQVLTDFESYFPYVVHGGTVILHDVSSHWPGPSKVWSEEVELKLIEKGSAMSIRYGVKP